MQSTRNFILYNAKGFSKALVLLKLLIIRVKLKTLATN